MNLAKAFAKSIDSTLVAVLEERARFFKGLYAEISNGPPVRQRYLDVGAGRLTNTRVFQEDFEETYALDLRLRHEWGRLSTVNLILGDAQALPLKPGTFDLVSMFSVIEHVPSPQESLSEVVSLLRPGGEIIIQAPNPRFPVDLHTGLPNPFLVPSFARRTFLKAPGYGNWLEDVHSHPGQKDLTGWLNGTMKLTGVRGVVYPSHFVPRGIRALYSFLAKTRFLHLVPPTYLYVYRRVG